MYHGGVHREAYREVYSPLYTREAYREVYTLLNTREAHREVYTGWVYPGCIERYI